MKNSNFQHSLISVLIPILFFISLSLSAQNTDSLDNQESLSTPLHLAKEKLTESDLIKTTFAQETRLVSVSRSEKELKDIPSTVYVVTREEILENGYITLVDVMKAVPWIKVSQPGSGVLGEMFFMRGQIGNEYTKILINNVPIQPAVNGGLAIGSQLPIAQAERIEIVYGPASAVYGGDAVAGVVNIITQTSEKSAYAQANAYFGTDNYRHVDFLAGGKAGRDRNVLQYSIYGNLTKRDDLPLDRGSEAFNPFDTFLRSLTNDPQTRRFLTNLATNQPDSFLRILENNAGLTSYVGGDPFKAKVNQLPEQSSLIGVKFNYRKLQVSIDEMYSRRHSVLGRTPAFFSYANPETYMGQTTRRTHFSYQTSNKKSSFLINASYLYYRLDANSSFGTNYNIGRSTGRSYRYEGSDDIFLESIYTRKFNPNFELTGGFSSTISVNLPITNDLERSFDVNLYNDMVIKNIIKPDPILGTFGYNPNTFLNGGAFIQAYYTNNKWVGVFGARLDGRSRFENDSSSSNLGLNPRISILYKVNPNKLSFRVSGATAFRAPPPSTQFTSLALPDLTTDSVIYQQIPNPNLNSETSITIETGLRYFPSKNITVDVVAYFTGTNSPIVGRFRPINKDIYPNASILSGNANGTARIFINDDDSKSAIYGIQGIFKIKNLVGRIHLDTDFFFSYTQGSEILPDNGGTINDYRMQPNFMGQWRISFRPSPKWYINLQNVMMSSWYRRNTFNIEQYKEERAKTDGYYTLDMLARHYFNKNVSAYFRVNNVFNAKYGGIDATGLDVDATFNPQLQQNIQAGVSFRIN